MGLQLVNHIKVKKKSIETIYDVATFILVLFSFAYKDNRVILYTYEVFYVILISLKIVKGKVNISQYFVWSALFLTACLFSCVYAIDKSIAFKQTFNVLKILLIGNSVVLFINRDKKKLNFVLHSILCSAVYLSILLIINTPANHWGTSRLGDAIGINSNDLGLKMAIASIITLYFGKANTKKYYYLISIMFSIITFLSGSRKAFFLIIIGLILLYTLTLKKRRRAVIAFPILMAIAYIVCNAVMNIPEIYYVLGIRIEQMMNAFLGQGTIDESTFIRFSMIKAGVELFKQRPLLGYGIANYASISSFSIYSHNNYIELLVGLGFIGAFIYYSFYFYLVNNLLKVIKKSIISGLFITLILGLALMEYGLVSYYTEIYQIIIACAYAAIGISYDYTNMDNNLTNKH